MTQFIRGVYFHASADYKAAVSTGFPSDYGLDKQLGDLFTPQKYQNVLKAGQEFYFVYPVTTPRAGNMQVFGKGEILQTCQKEREKGILVPFIQYFACKISESLNCTFDFQKFFEEHNITYEEMFSKYQQNQEVTVNPVPMPESSFSKEPCSEHLSLQDSFGFRFQKTKRYTTLTEGLQIIDCLMHSPKIIKWSFSVLLTPLDVDYRQSIILVYGQAPKNIEQDKNNPSMTSSINSLNFFDQEDLVNRFGQFIANQNDPTTIPQLGVADPYKLLDTVKTEELSNLLKQFLTDNSQRQTKNEDLKLQYDSIIKIIDDLLTKKNLTKNELMQLNEKVDSYEKALKRNEHILSPNSIISISIPQELLAQVISKYSLDELQDAPSTAKITSAALGWAIRARIEASKDKATQFWKLSISQMDEIGQTMAVNSITQDGIQNFMTIGVNVTSDQIDSSTTFKELVSIMEKCTKKILSLTESTIKFPDVAGKAPEALQKLLSKLKDRINNLPATIDSLDDCLKTDEALVSAVEECLKSCRKTSNKINGIYSDDLDTLKEIMQIQGRKEQKTLQNNYKTKQEELSGNQKKINDRIKRTQELLKR